MPDTMAGNISKGRILRLLDAVLYTGEDVSAAIAELRAANPRLSQVFRNATAAALANPASHLNVINAAANNFNNLHQRERAHINAHWFGGLHSNNAQGRKGRSYWPEVPHPEVTVREAYLAALLSNSVSGVLQRPIVTYWLCAGKHFEVAVCNDSDDQVTVLLMTPSIAWRYLGARRGLAGGAVRNVDNPDASLTEDENIHVFADEHLVQAAVDESDMPVLRRPPNGRNDTPLASTRDRLVGAGNMRGRVHRYQVIGDQDNFVEN